MQSQNPKKYNKGLKQRVLNQTSFIKLVHHPLWVIKLYVCTLTKADCNNLLIFNTTTNFERCVATE